jgi:hypothetical protein
MTTLRSLIKDVFSPTVRGLHAKKWRRRKKALKLWEARPINHLEWYWKQDGKRHTCFQLSDRDKVIWQSTAVHEMPMFSSTTDGDSD